MKTLYLLFLFCFAAQTIFAKQHVSVDEIESKIVSINLEKNQEPLDSEEDLFEPFLQEVAENDLNISDDDIFDENLFKP